MNYKVGLHAIHEMNISGGAGGIFGAGGTFGGSVGNVDSYASGDARIPKVLGAGGNDPYEYVKKNKKNKKNKKTKMPLYRRAFIETLTMESSDEDYILNCIVYTENVNYQQVIKDLLEKLNIKYDLDDNCVILEGTDSCFQNILEKLQNVISTEPFDNNEILVLMGEMDISSNKIPGGKSEGKTIKDFYHKYDSKKYYDINNFEIEFKKKIEQGVKVEMEHTTSPAIAKEIALDHLWELGLNYYDELQKMENKLKK